MSPEVAFRAVGEGSGKHRMDISTSMTTTIYIDPWDEEDLRDRRRLPLYADDHPAGKARPEGDLRYSLFHYDGRGWSVLQHGIEF